MSFKETASTLDEAGRSCIEVRWKGDAKTRGACVRLARRRGGGEMESVKELCKSFPLVL